MFTHKRHMYSTLRHTGEEVKKKKEKQLTRARENGVFLDLSARFHEKGPRFVLPLPTLCLPSPEGAHRPERNMARLRFSSANAPSA